MIEVVGAAGYLAVFAGALFEGEVMLLAAGFAAQQGLLDLPLVIGIGAFGAALGDHTWFLLGRWKGRALRARFPALAARGKRVRAILHRHSTVTILLVRFLYGLRTAGAVLMGTTEMRAVNSLRSTWSVRPHGRLWLRAADTHSDRLARTSSPTCGRSKRFWRRRWRLQRRPTGCGGGSRATPS